MAIRATSVEDIIGHLNKQGKRWADQGTNKPLAQVIADEIGPLLREQVVEAMEVAARKVTTLPEALRRPTYVPNPDWVAQEQLALARLYMGVLVAWRRIDFAYHRSLRNDTFYSTECPIDFPRGPRSSLSY